MKTCAKCQEENPLHARSLCAACYHLFRASFPIQKKQRPYTAKERDFIRQNWHKLSTEEVARELGRKPDDVRDAAVRFGCHLEERRPKTTPEDRRRIKKLHAAGRSNNAIAEKLKLAKSTVNRWIRIFGLQPHGYTSLSRKTHRKTIKAKIKEDGLEYAVPFLKKNLDERVAVAESGWPQVDTLLEVSILDCLWEHGASTAAQIVDDIGGSRNADWVAQVVRSLKRRAFVVVLYRVGKYCVYGLADGLKKHGDCQGDRRKSPRREFPLISY